MIPMPNLGFVGLGVMGGQMVKRLLDGGHRVTSYNRTRGKAQWLLDMGMHWADSPRAVAEAADIVFSMVTDSKALQAVVDGPAGVLAGLGPGKTYVDMSTANPSLSQEYAARAAESGAVMLNAPVSGSVITLQEGKLSIMVGGPREAFDRVKPILEDIGPTVTHVGGNLQAVSMKIATNLSLAVQMLAFCEAVLLAEKSGVARDMALDVLGRETAVEVLVNTVVASPMVRYRGPFVLSMPVEAWFNVNMMQKDLNLALEMGQRLNVPLPTTAISNEFLTAARGMGFAKRDFAVVFDVLARMAGVDTGVEK